MGRREEPPDPVRWPVDESAADLQAMPPSEWLALGSSLPSGEPMSPEVPAAPGETPPEADPDPADEGEPVSGEEAVLGEHVVAEQPMLAGKPGVSVADPAGQASAVLPTGWHMVPDPSPEPGSRSRRPRQSRLVVAGALAAFVAAAIGVGLLTFSHRAHVGQPARSAHPGSQAAGAQGAVSPRSSHQAPAARTPGQAVAPAAAVFPAVAGVGCAPLPGTSAITGVRGGGGDGWASVSGGLHACGGQALASRKTGTLGLVQDVFTWTFRVGHPATCTAEIFIADTNPSSGFAHYNVYGDSLAPGTSIGQFVIEQVTRKGQWVREGTWNVAGTLHIQLTDAPAYAGDQYHVTASAARATCS